MRAVSAGHAPPHRARDRHVRQMQRVEFFSRPGLFVSSVSSLDRLLKWLLCPAVVLLLPCSNVAGRAWAATFMHGASFLQGRI